MFFSAVASLVFVATSAQWDICRKVELLSSPVIFVENNARDREIVLIKKITGVSGLTSGSCVNAQ